MCMRYDAVWPFEIPFVVERMCASLLGNEIVSSGSLVVCLRVSLYR